MIRRPQPGVDSQPQWVLISQVEHARVSGELAEHWAAGALAPRDELVATIYHHDDGWREWEQRPDVDPEPGRPRAFTEMPLADSLVIWQRSIDAAARLGNLAPY